MFRWKPLGNYKYVHSTNKYFLNTFLLNLSGSKQNSA